MEDAVGRLNSALADRYSVKEMIGEGGMATVYLAEDLKHHRRVALKVLRPELAAIIGGERFLKEIEVTANLQHPNILPLYDSGDADSFLYYVMPLMEGETLRDKLDREHQLQVEEAVEIARDVAAAVDYAHRNGVIHRDLKPSNILLHEGKALVADFGIALAVQRGGGETRLTETGLSVGTPYYMSPEQAAGDRELDARSDLYSLGAVMYEMLVGEPPHMAKTAQAVVAKILSDTPAPIRRTRELIPANVEAAVTRALARSPADRFPSVADFGAALTNPGFTLPSMQAAGAGAGGAAPAGFWSRLGPVAAGVAAVAILLALWGWMNTPEPPATARYNLAFLPGQELQDGNYQRFDVARGGRAIVYQGPGEEGAQLWVKRRDQLEATPLPGTTGASLPSISPDGTEVVFWTATELKRIPVQGGAPITLVDSAVFIQPAWMDDGTLVYSASSESGPRLRRIPVPGGEPKELWPDMPDSVFGAVYPAALPGSDGVLFTLCTVTNCEEYGIWALDLGSGEAHELIPGGLRAWYLESGHLAYVRPDGAVFAVPFDVGNLEVTGNAVPLLEGVKVDNQTWPDLAIASDGTLLMMTGEAIVAGPNREMIWISREGVVQQVDPAWQFRQARNGGWALSPDGTRLAIGINTEEGDDIWIKELDQGPSWRLTYTPEEEAEPRWLSDGETVRFISRRRDGATADLYDQRADGAGDAVPALVRDQSAWQHETSPDGAWIVTREGGQQNQTGGRDLIGYSVQGDTAAVPLMASEYDEVSPSFSPDGRWIAYASQETGEWEIYVRPFPDVNSGKWPVSRGGGTAPRWSHSGREIFYMGPDSTMNVAAVDAGESFRVRARQTLFRFPRGMLTSGIRVYYDVSPDDQRFMAMRELGAEEERPPTVILVENWLQEVRQRVEGGGG